MTNSPIIDDKERENIRWRLQQYQQRHGEMGVPKLYEHMRYHLREINIDLFHLDLRSLQRFMRDDVRTADEKVVRYRKFLEIVFPKSDGFGEDFVNLLREKMVFPASVQNGTMEYEEDGEIIELITAVSFDQFYWRKPLIDYQGVYDVEHSGYGAEVPDPDPDTASSRRYVFLPGASEQTLRVFSMTRFDGGEGEEPQYFHESSNLAFMKCGRGQFLLASVAFENLGFTLLRDTTPDDADIRTLLSGHVLQTIAPETGQDGIGQVRLVKIDGPEFPRD